MDNHTKLTEEDFQAIGQYVYYFEKLVGDVRVFVYFMLDFRGLDSLSVSSIILGNKLFTAGPLLDLCASIFGDQTNLMNNHEFKDVNIPSYFELLASYN